MSNQRRAGLDTIAELVATRTGTAFALDLMAAVVVALVFMAVEARRIGMHGVWRYYVLLALFGLGGTLPLFLWSRERRSRVGTPIG